MKTMRHQKVDFECVENCHQLCGFNRYCPAYKAKFDLTCPLLERMRERKIKLKEVGVMGVRLYAPVDTVKKKGGEVDEAVVSEEE